MQMTETVNVFEDGLENNGTEEISFVKAFEENLKAKRRNLAETNKAELTRWAKESVDMGSSFNIGVYVENNVEKILVSMNYICYLRDYLGTANYKITLFYNPSTTDIESIISRDIVDEAYSINLVSLKDRKVIDKYDLFLNIDTYPRIIGLIGTNVICQMPSLIDYIMAIKKFELINDRYEKVNSIDAQYNILCSLKKKNNINKIDVSEFLNIDKRARYKIQIEDSMIPIILNKYGINGDYIILVNEFAEGYGINDNRLWPVDYFNILISKIRAKYPDITIVQIQTRDIDGIDEENKEKCYIKGVDVYLDNISISDQIVLLKKAKLLICNDCSCAHIRHFIDNELQSIVIYTSTELSMHSYDSNINLQGKKCLYPCEGLYCDWERKCKHTPRRSCQWEITPNAVVDKIKIV